MDESCYSKSGVAGGFYSLLHVMKQNRKKATYHGTFTRKI